MTDGNKKGIVILGALLAIAAIVLIGLYWMDQRITPEERSALELERSLLYALDADSSLARFRRFAESASSWGVVFDSAYVRGVTAVVVVTDGWYSLPRYQQERLVISTTNMWKRSAIGKIDSGHLTITDNWGKRLAASRFRSDGTVMVDFD